tara:strand:- start:486 stop:695 length:210 start_codon:yes stop_codon:yes gene_type:complete
MSNTLNKIKETWVDNEVESSFFDSSFVKEVLTDYFLSLVKDKNKEEFIEYLEELNYDEDIIDSYFEDSE